MNYWLLTTEYPPFFGGGIGTYSSNTAEMLAGKGHTVSVFINDASVRDYIIASDKGIRIIRFSPARTNSSSFLGHTTNISYEFAHIIKLFIEKEGKPDIIEAQEYLGIAYYLLQYKYLLYEWCKEIPVLITMHSPSFLYMEYNHVPSYRYPNYWLCEMERFCLQAATHVISPSQYMLNELGKRFLIFHKNITVVPNPFKITEPVSQETSSNQKADEIVFYGKLTAQKGAFRLLADFKERWDSGFARPLFLLGGQDIVYHPEGIAMGDLIRKKYKKYISNGLLILENRIKPSEIAGRLASAEVVIIPSNNDNLPYVVFEMMGLGKIVLVSKQGGHTEVVEDGIDGFIFDHLQPGSFSRQLDRILALGKEERKAISANAVKKVKDGYSHDRIYEKKLDVLNNIAARSVPAAACFPFVRPELTKSVGRDLAGDDKKLSVVIPYFNMGKYIDETINSVNKSYFLNIEIIIVNDGSTDPESLNKLDSYRDRPGIRIIDTPNEGVANARNIGARQATGKYLAFLDGDDMVVPTYYLRAVGVLSHYSNVHFAGCWTQYFEGSAKVWPTFQPEPPLILYHNLVNSSSLVYNRESFLSAGMNDKEMIFQGLEDYESVVSMTTKGCLGVSLPEPLFKYRVRMNSMIRSISHTKRLLLYQHIVAKHKTAYAEFAVDILNLFNANGPGISIDNPSLDLHLADKMPFGGKVSLQLIRLIKKNRFAKTIAYKIYRIINK